VFGDTCVGFSDSQQRWERPAISSSAERLVHQLEKSDDTCQYVCTYVRNLSSVAQCLLDSLTASEPQEGRAARSDDHSSHATTMLEVSGASLEQLQMLVSDLRGIPE
jgi:hypothetical protein